MEFEDTKQISMEQPQQFSSRAPAYPAAAAVGGGCATAEYATGTAYQCYQQQQAYDPRQQPLQQQQQHMMQALSDVCKFFSNKSEGEEEYLTYCLRIWLLIHSNM